MASSDPTRVLRRCEPTIIPAPPSYFAVSFFVEHGFSDSTRPKDVQAERQRILAFLIWPRFERAPDEDVFEIGEPEIRPIVLGHFDPMRDYVLTSEGRWHQGCNSFTDETLVRQDWLEMVRRTKSGPSERWQRPPTLTTNRKE